MWLVKDEIQKYRLDFRILCFNFDLFFVNCWWKENILTKKSQITNVQLNNFWWTNSTQSLAHRARCWTSLSYGNVSNIHSGYCFLPRVITTLPSSIWVVFAYYRTSYNWNYIISYSWTRLLSFNTILERFINVVACSLQYSILLCDCRTLFIFSTVDRHVGSFQFGAVMHRAAKTIPVHVFWWIYV